MSPALFLSNLKSHRGTIAAWGVLLLAFALIVVTLYPRVKEIGFFEVWMVESMPEPLRIAITGSGVGSSPLTPEGYIRLDAWLTLEYTSWWPLTVAVYATIFTSGIVAREVERGTIDLILSHPLRRYQLVMSKFTVFLVGVFAISIASLAGIALGLGIIQSPGPYKALTLVLLQGGLLVVAIGGYTTLFSCLFLEPRRALVASGTLTAALYLLNLTGSLLGPLEGARRISPFYYFRAQQIMDTGQLDWAGVGFYLGIAVACVILSLVVFQRRDIAP